ncbi:MAG: hypothetical protein ACOC0P_06440, partial [Planctomycetota bacterium]
MDRHVPTEPDSGARTSQDCCNIGDTEAESVHGAVAANAVDEPASASQIAGGPLGGNGDSTSSTLRTAPAYGSSQDDPDRALARGQHRIASPSPTATSPAHSLTKTGTPPPGYQHPLGRAWWSFLPASVAPFARRNYRHELAAMSTWSIAITMIEGSVVGIIA